jgi:diguanylate cyclase (GGDEF)-like protein
MATEYKPLSDSSSSGCGSKLSQLQTKNQELVQYIRAKTNRLLQVMGTVPLNPDELDDETLLTVDPIGIVTEAFEQVLEHLHTTNSDLSATRDELQAVFDSVGAGIIVVNEQMLVVAYNYYSLGAFFPDQTNVIGMNLRGLICGHEGEECILDQILSTGRRVEQPNFFHDGRHYHLVGTPLKGADNQVSRMVLLYTDISERRAAAQEIERLAFFDSLTGLPNRVLLTDRLNQMLTRAGRHKEMVALLFIDLDRFKEVNDTLGHSSGDLLLQAVAERLAVCLRTSDTVARLGGDEFVVLLDGVEERDGIVEVATKLLSAISQPIEIFDREIYSSGSIGISLYPCDGDNVDTLFKNADTAMYHAKEQGRNTFRFYSAEMHSSALEMLTLSSYLRHAMERNELYLLYQPQISFVTGELVGVEALLRWKHPGLGMIFPDRFIPLAEETGLIVPIGTWVLKEACSQAEKWISQGLPAMRVAVNLSAKQFRNPGLVSTVSTILKQSGLPPHLLELELTEGMLIENIASTNDTLKALKAMGVTLAIDDFGTGYSSLSYLRHFPLDRLKIDKSFVLEMAEKSGDSAVIVQAIIALAHSLKLIVIAEGVERPDQVAFLKQHCCDEMQGFFFSRPLTSESLEELLKKYMHEPDFCLYNYR